MAPSLSQEFRLAAACSIWPPSPRRDDAIRKASAGPIDWARFLRIVRRQGMIGLAHDGLNRAQIRLPTDIAREIAEHAAALVRENLALSTEAGRLHRLFAESDLPVLFIKGVSLAKLVYRNLGIRQGKDIDLLVAPASLPAATALVEHAGYCRFIPPAEASSATLELLMSLRKDFGYIHEQSRRQLELHWRLFFNPHFVNETSFMASSQVVPLSETIGLRTLGQDDLFIYLCAHGALHWWYQLKWLADIGALLKSVPMNGIERYYRAAEVRGLGRPAAQAILLCHRLFGTEVPDQLLATFRASATLRWLESTALSAMTAGNGELEPKDLLFGTTRGSLSCFLLRHDWRYWLAELKLHSICEADVLTVTLPPRLQFLYPPLRLPLWLWRHRVRHGGPAR
jgi:Uncharacterised nucleotidyltransferase